MMRADVLSPSARVHARNSAPVSLFAIFACLLTACSDDQSPRFVEVSAQPGETVTVRFDRPVKGKPVRALSFVPASPRLNPKPLPHGAELVYSSLALYGGGDVSGNLLIHVPQNAQGEIQFKVSASGNGSNAIGGAAAFFSTDDAEVTIDVNGAAVEATPPDLAGEWRDGERVWTFEQSYGPTLKTRHPSGEEKTLTHEVYSAGQGRWFLIGFGIDADAYWIEMDGADNMRAAFVGDEFDPFASFARVISDGR